MKPFNSSFTDISMYTSNARKPDFNNLLKVLGREKPDRPTLFEFFLNDSLYKRLAPYNYAPDDELAIWKCIIDAYKNAGYDYVTMHGSDISFQTNRHKEKGGATISLNAGAIIHDRNSFEGYDWPDPDKYDYSRLYITQ